MLMRHTQWSQHLLLSRDLTRPCVRAASMAETCTVVLVHSIRCNVPMDLPSVGHAHGPGMLRVHNQGGGLALRVSTTMKPQTRYCILLQSHPHLVRCRMRGRCSNCCSATDNIINTRAKSIALSLCLQLQRVKGNGLNTYG